MSDMSEGDELAKKLLRADSQSQVLRAQQDGVIPMALGIGMCAAITWSYLKRSKRVSRIHRVMLCAVAVLNTVIFIIMIVDLRAITSTPRLGDLFDQDTTYLYSTYLCFSFIAIIAQTFFGLRAWRLWGRKWYILVTITVLSATSFILRFIYTVWSYTGPTLLSSTQGDELSLAAGWYTRYINARQALQIGSGIAGLACDIMISGLIITRLLRMKTLMASSSLVDKLISLTMESMLPPMFTALAYIIVRLCPIWSSTCSMGAGTWSVYSASGLILGSGIWARYKL